MSEVTIQTIIDMMHSDPAGISSKYGIPLRTVYSWCEGTRRPPDYVLTMMLNIILLERRILTNGNTSEGLENRMGENTEGIPETGKKS